MVEYDKFKILRENNYIPSMIFFYRKCQFKIVLGHNTFNCQPIFNFLQHILEQTKSQILQRKYFGYS